MKRIAVAVAILGALALAGCTDTSGATVTVTANPVPAVTVTAEGVASVPQSCLDAFDDAEVIFGVAGDVATIASEAIMLIPKAAEAGIYSDVAALERITSDLTTMSVDIEEKTNIVTSSTYQTNRDACLAGK